MTLKDFFSKQARKPSGLFGRMIMSRIFEKGNADLNALMKDLLSVEKTDHILEIGFGPGWLISRMAAMTTEGGVEGIDFSQTMVSMARKRNREYIKNGRVKLREGRFEQISYPPNHFDKVCTANTLYFWPDPVDTLTRIHETLKPGGKLVMGFGDKDQLKKKEFSEEVFRLYALPEVRELLKTAGFTGEIDILSEQGKTLILHCAVAVK